MMIKVIGLLLMSYVVGLFISRIAVVLTFKIILFGYLKVKGIMLYGQEYLSYIEANPVFVIISWIVRVILELYVIHIVFVVFEYKIPLSVLIVYFVYYFFKAFYLYGVNDKKCPLDKNCFINIKYPLYILIGVIVGFSISLILFLY